MSPIPEAIRALFDAPNFVHLSTLGRDGAPRNWIVWVGLEGDQVVAPAPRRLLDTVELDRPHPVLGVTARPDHEGAGRERAGSADPVARVVGRPEMGSAVGEGDHVRRGCPIRRRQG